MRRDILKGALVLSLTAASFSSVPLLGESYIAQASATQNVSGTYQITANALNVREGASTNFKSVGLLKKGETISVIGKMENDWYRVTFKGKTAYVSGKYLKKVNDTQAQNKVAQGKVVQLKVPYYNQYLADAPMGCEASALLQALHYKGYAKDYNLKTFLKQMPIDKNGNPNNGFGGTPYKVVKGVYQSIFAKPLAQWGSEYGTVEDISGASVAQLKEELDKGNPIVVYITLDYKAPVYEKYNWGTGIDNAHVVTLTGYKDGYYHVTDPARGVKWVSAKSFEYSYNLTKSAVVVR